MLALSSGTSATRRVLTAIGGYDPRDPFSVSAAMPDLLGACRASVADLRIAYSTTLGYARPDTDVAAIVEVAPPLRIWLRGRRGRQGVRW